MRELLKLLNDLSPTELGLLTRAELARFESLCEQWTSLAETERARRKLLPRSDDKHL
jgi:hypothetical protein